MINENSYLFVHKYQSPHFFTEIAENFFVTSQISPLIPVRVWLIDWLQVPRAQISISGVFISIVFSISHSLHEKENEYKTRNDDQQIFLNNKVEVSNRLSAK